jgi:hypothetical protein
MIKKIYLHIKRVIEERRYRKKYKPYFENNYLIKKRKKLSENDLKIINSFFYLKEFRLLKHRYERYENLDELFLSIKNKKKLNLIEFGVYRGDSFLFFCKKLNRKKNIIIGIDSFQDFKKSNHRWKKGKFLNTSVSFVKDLLIKNKIDSNFFLIKSYFDEKNLFQRIWNITNKIEIFHFDSDQYESTKQALQLSLPFIKKNDISYLLFDDWGCFKDQVPRAFFEFFTKLKKDYKYEIISNSFYTMYIKLIKSK